MIKKQCKENKWKSLSNLPSKVTEEDAAIYVDKLEPIVFHSLQKKIRDIWEKLPTIAKYNSLRTKYKKMIEERNKQLASSVKETRRSIEQHLIHSNRRLNTECLTNEDIVDLHLKVNEIIDDLLNEIRLNRQASIMETLDSLKAQRKNLRNENAEILDKLYTTPSDDEISGCNNHGNSLCKTIMEEAERCSYANQFRSNYYDITKLTKKIKIIRGCLS